MEVIEFGPETDLDRNMLFSCIDFEDYWEVY